MVGLDTEETQPFAGEGEESTGGASSVKLQDVAYRV